MLTFDTVHIGARGRDAGDLFSALLVKAAPAVSVVERTQLEKILAEQILQQHGGIVDQETAARLKSVLGVDSLVLGSIVALDHDAYGSGTLMMTARLVDTSSGRILWAETRTARIRDHWLKRFARVFVDPAPVSDKLVTGRLLELACAALVEDLGARLRRAVAAPPAAAAAVRPSAMLEEASACARAEAGVTRLGESILGDEALYWAHRLKAGDALRGDPGAAYSDAELRERLTVKILFWLGESDLPPLQARPLARIAEAKESMLKLRMLCPAVATARTGGSLFASATAK